MVNLPKDVVSSIQSIFQDGTLNCETTVISEADAKHMPWFEKHDGLWQSDPRETALIFVDDLVIWKHLAREDVHLWDLRRGRELSVPQEYKGQLNSKLVQAFEDSVLNEGLLTSFKGLQSGNYVIVDVFQCFLGETDAHRVMQGLYSVMPNLMSLPFRFRRSYGFNGIVVERKSEDTFNEDGFPEWERCTFQDYLTAWMEMTV